VVLQAIEKDRGQRVQSMDALVAALQPFASVKSAGSGEHVSIEMQRAALPGAKHRARWTMAAVPVLVVLLSALAWWVMQERAPSAATDGASPGSPTAVTSAAVAEPARADAISPAIAPSAATVPVQPTLQPSTGAAHGESAKPSLRGEPMRSTRAATRRQRAGQTTTEARAPNAPPAEAVPAPATRPSGSTPARSGSIKVDEL